MLLLLLGLEFLVWAVNVEGLIAYLTLYWHMTARAQLVVVVPIVVVGNTYSYSFWGYLRKQGHILELLNLISSTMALLPPAVSRRSEEVKYKILVAYGEALRYEKRNTLQMFVIGACAPGVRTLALAYSGLTRWSSGMAFLTMGDLAKTILEVGFLSSMPPRAFGAIAVVIIGRIVYKLATRKSTVDEDQRNYEWATLSLQRSVSSV